MKTLKIKRARELATFWHQNQVRKYTDEPYIVHPAAVAKLIRDNGGTEDQICAAWMHDVLEDTNCPEKDIAAFGSDVLRMVKGMTNPSKPADGNRAARQAIDRQWLSEQYRDVLEIRICDIFDNTKSIERYDPKFAYGTYVPEKRLMLPTLKRASDFPLFWKMFEIINSDE
jgi:(p)ppGpp synthase/HD superfamily hydrolase